SCCISLRYCYFKLMLVTGDNWNVRRYTARYLKGQIRIYSTAEIFIMYTIFILVVYIIFIVFNCIYLSLYCLIETTVHGFYQSVHGSNTDSNVDISPFTRDNYIHGHHSSTTSCLHFVCVCNKSHLIGTLASLIVLTGQTCGDCHLIIKLAIQSFLGFIQLNIPLFYIFYSNSFLLIVECYFNRDTQLRPPPKKMSPAATVDNMTIFIKSGIL